jgi:protein-tyrosine kinase
MSKFFNETSNVQQSPATARAAAAAGNVDIQQLVSSFKQSAENGTAPANGSSTDLVHLLKPLKESHDAALQVVAGRLEKCPKVQLPRTDAKSFLVTQYNPELQAAVEAYRTLRTRLVKLQNKNGSRSLVVSSAAQGEGKSLTAFNLALCYANIQNWPVLAVDADLRTRGLSRLMGDPESLGLSGILEGACDAQAAVRATDIPGFYVLPAGDTTASPSELFSGTRWKEFMGWASDTFRLVIVDSPPILNLADFELLLARCESALVVVRARTTNRKSLIHVLSQIDPKKLAGVVFNGAEEGAGYRYSDRN